MIVAMTPLKYMKIKSIVAIVGFVAASATHSYGEYFLDKDPGTAGNQSGSVHVPVAAPGGNTVSSSEGWEKLTATQYPAVKAGFPGSADWNTVAASHVGANSGTSYLYKTANGAGGGPYPASRSIYFGGTSATTNLDGGELSVYTDATKVIPGLKTAVLQIDIGEAWTYDVYAAPVLYYNLAGGGSGSLAASYQTLYKEVGNGQIWMDGKWEVLNINSRAYQFNLNGIGTIESFAIVFKGVQHAQLHGIGLQQFNAAAGGPIIRPNVP